MRSYRIVCPKNEKRGRAYAPPLSLMQRYAIFAVPPNCAKLCRRLAQREAGLPEQFQAITSDGLMVSTRHIYFPDIEKESSSSDGCAGFIGVFFAYRDMRN